MDVDEITKSPNIDPDEDGYKARWCSLTSEAYTYFHGQLDAIAAQFPALTSFLPVDRIVATNGTFPWKWGASSEVREAINSVNAWGVRLHEWHAWQRVVELYESDEDKWELLYHFIEPIAFYCLLQPSAISEQVTVVAEMLLHQANRLLFSDYPDCLEQDRLSEGKVLGRSKRRKQLNKLGRYWSCYSAFSRALRVLNDDFYKCATGNFRDLSAHSFAPRLMSGDILRAPRTLVSASNIEAQVDSLMCGAEFSNRTVVSYDMAVVRPLPIDEAYTANFAEYQKALLLMQAFSALIYEICDRAGEAPTSSSV